MCLNSLDINSRPARIRTRAGTADQASEHVLSLAVAHATATLSRQLVGTSIRTANGREATTAK